MAKRKPVNNVPSQPTLTLAPATKNFFAGKFRLMACALIVVVTLLAYHNISQNGFVFDDYPNIAENPRIRNLWPPWEMLTHSLRPVVTLSLAVNYSFGGLNPSGYHVFNVMVHILAALVLYGIVRRTLLGVRLRSQFGTVAEGLALTVVLIWDVHPLQTESVTYTIQRGESLMGLFYLLTLYCVIRSQESVRVRTWQIVAVASCALGMASKAVMVSAPVIVLLYDRAYWARSWGEVLQRRWVLYAGLMATWLLLPVLLENREFREPTAGFAFKGIGPGEYALTQPGVILHYLRLVFWPTPLCLDYGWPLARSVGETLPGMLVVGGLLAAAVWAWRRQPELGFLGAWFFLILAPTSSFVPIADLIFEHRMYLPLAAVVTLVVLGAHKLAGRFAGNGQKFSRILIWGVGGLALVLLTAGTIRRNLDYRSELTIWQDTVGKSPGKPRAFVNLGKALFETGDTEAAIRQFEQALRLDPSYPEAHDNLGLCFDRLGRIQDAINHYEQALRFKPDDAAAHNNWGSALLKLGQPAAALGHIEQALRLQPDYAEARCNQALAYSQTGRMDEAIRSYERALQLRPDSAEAHSGLGILLAQTGKLPEAIRHFEEAVRLKPDYAEAHNNLGNALALAGKAHDAIPHYEQALRIRPDFADAKINLARARAAP